MTVGGRETRECPYCFTEIVAAATRCPHCAGEMRWCKRCGEMVAVTSKRKFVGIARGVTQDQLRCAQCDKVLEGPRW